MADKRQEDQSQDQSSDNHVLEGLGLRTFSDTITSFSQQDSVAAQQHNRLRQLNRLLYPTLSDILVPNEASHSTSSPLEGISTIQNAIRAIIEARGRTTYLVESSARDTTTASQHSSAVVGSFSNINLLFDRANQHVQQHVVSPAQQERHPPAQHRPNIVPAGPVEASSIVAADSGGVILKPLRSRAQITPSKRKAISSAS
ncbi:hypothetical protein EDB80DRAFT_690949 [Ilyonectria destructans]|nr:hypothetical protein EDB80DRAFT_690949 [Ilyonectria destructans]